MSRKILGTATTVVALAATAVVATTASADYKLDIAIVADNDIDGPVAEAAVGVYSQHGKAKRWDANSPLLHQFVDDADCVVVVGANAYELAGTFERRDGRAIVPVQGGDRYATARQVVHPDTVEACIG